MYPKEISEPIKKEIEVRGISNLETALQVDDFIKKNQNENSVLLINSVCGCAAGLARPGLYQSLNHRLSPATNQIASVFAGVDPEATYKAREYLAGYSPSSPSIAFFRKGELMYVLERHNIEGLGEGVLNKIISSVYEKFFAAEIKPELEIIDPLKVSGLQPQDLDKLSEKEKILDCRSEAAFKQHSIPGSELLNQEKADEIVANWDKATKIIFYCTDGSLSPRVINYFKQYGFINTFILDGGYNAYINYSQNKK